MTERFEHPTLDEIDAIRTGEGAQASTAHVASCDSCQSALADLHAIAVALRKSQPGIDIPDAIDRRVLWLAQKQAASIRRDRRLHPARWAIAASLLLALGAAGLWQWSSTPLLQRANAPGNAHDVDGDGHIDILDAFALARSLERSSAASKGWDIDRDGRVDRHDVDLIARAAVALGKS